MVLSIPTSWTSTWPKSHFLVILPLIYSVTRRNVRLDTMKHWAPLHLEFLLWYGTIATNVTSTCCRAKQVCRKDPCMRLGKGSQVHRFLENGLYVLYTVHCAIVLELQFTLMLVFACLSTSRCFHTSELNSSHRSFGYKTLLCPQHKECPIWYRTHVWVWTRDCWYIWCCTSSKRTIPSFILLLRTGDSHLVHIPRRHFMFLRPVHDLRSSTLPEKAVSEKRFIAILGEVHLHCWSFIVVRHGGHVHRDVFCCLFTRFATTHFSRACFSPPLMSHLIQSPGYHGDMIIRASIALDPSEGVSLMFTHSSR